MLRMIDRLRFLYTRVLLCRGFSFPLYPRRSWESSRNFGGARTIFLFSRFLRIVRKSGGRKKNDCHTFGRYHSAAHKVDLVPYEDHRPRGHVVASPQRVENLFGDPHRLAIRRRVDDAVRVRLVRRDAIFRLQALIVTGRYINDLPILTRSKPISTAYFARSPFVLQSLSSAISYFVITNVILEYCVTSAINWLTTYYSELIFLFSKKTYILQQKQ